MKQGMEQGMKQILKIAKKLLEMNIPICKSQYKIDKKIQNKIDKKIQYCFSRKCKSLITFSGTFLFSIFNFF